ncbi:hypothetical protein DWB77_02460 [Streptomyces hundungensis]|uniref:Uncharacterized protein n=1 Tax=Streptomyces hundungensis TaxID=1077946 RepID=A0A387HA99_9ACTN|nr:hypothetical protein [Streptomyces hundungensis]AYG80329.1 hypothetical protein DWB77_02460 [Streptomyces hundungensis]
MATLFTGVLFGVLISAMIVDVRQRKAKPPLAALRIAMCVASVVALVTSIYSYRR